MPEQEEEQEEEGQPQPQPELEPELPSRSGRETYRGESVGIPSRLVRDKEVRRRLHRDERVCAVLDVVLSGREAELELIPLRVPLRAVDRGAARRLHRRDELSPLEVTVRRNLLASPNA